MLRFRTIRQRPRRARKGQVSAVATVLALLLVVTFVSNYLVGQLPLQLSTAELNHILKVENQISRLQVTVLAQARSPTLGLTLSAPVTLGSQAVPPFGPPAAGAIYPEVAAVGTKATFSVADVQPLTPSWGSGSACLTGGAGTCATNSAFNTWNTTNNNGSTFTIKITGTSESLAYNLSANNDTIVVQWSGGNTKFLYVVIDGSNNIVTYTRSGTDTTAAPTAVFLFYGSNDVFNYNPSGSTSSSGGIKVKVAFAGSQSGTCPYGNLSSTDRVGTLTAGGTNLNLSVVWWNAVGYVSPVHSQTYPGGAAKNETIRWSNQSAPLACPFTKLSTSAYQSLFGSGIYVRLFNRYMPQTDVAYDQGAVIQSQLGGVSLMVSPPEISYGVIPAGFSASVTLVNLVGAIPTETGITTAAIATRVVSVATVVLAHDASGSSLSSLFNLNVTTLYPHAWQSFFQQLGPLIPGGASCKSPVAIAAPYSCGNPPFGQYVTIVAPIYAQQLTLTTITVTVALF